MTNKGNNNNTLLMKSTTTSATTTTNKRVKVTLACAVCRKKKVKCDGIQPTCSRCHNMGFDCHYSDPPKKRGPPKGQVEIIESRAHRIESLRVGGTKNHSDHKILSSAVPNPVIDMKNNHDIKIPLSSKPTTIYSKNTIMCLISGAVDTIHSNKRNLSHHHQHLQVNTPGSQYTRTDFLIKNDSKLNDYSQWATYYFNYFNIFFPVLSKPHFMRHLSHHDVDQLLLYAVSAIGTQYSNADGTDELSQYYFEKCLVILNTSHDSTTLSTVQALVILCWYAYLLGNMQTCCELRQQLVKTVNGLQLYRDPESSLGTFTIEMRRRAFWVTFVIDQWLSCCTGERYFILQEGWNCQYPQLEDSQLLIIDSKQWKSVQQHQDSFLYHRHNSNNSNDDDDYQDEIHDLSAEYALQITAFSEMIKLARIVGDMHNLYTSPSSLSTSSFIHHHQPLIISQLTDWLLRLPPYLEYGKPMDDSPPSPIARIYHVFYYTLQIMLYQPFLQHDSLNTIINVTDTKHPHNNVTDSNMARTICTNAANTIIHIAEQMIQHKQHLYLKNTFMASFTFAVSVHLDNTIHLDQRHGVSSLLSLDKSIRVLKKCNRSLLSSIEFDQLVDRFLLDHYGIKLDGNHDGENDDKESNDNNNNNKNNYHCLQQQQQNDSSILTTKINLKRSSHHITENGESINTNYISVYGNNNDHHPTKRKIHHHNKELNHFQTTLSNTIHHHHQRHHQDNDLLDIKLESLLSSTTTNASTSSSSNSPTISLTLNSWLDDHDVNNGDPFLTINSLASSSASTETSISSSYPPPPPFWTSTTSNSNSPKDSLHSPPLISSDDSSLYSPTLSNDYNTSYDISSTTTTIPFSTMNYNNNDNNTQSFPYCYYMLNEDKDFKSINTFYPSSSSFPSSTTTITTASSSSSTTNIAHDYYDFLSDTLITINNQSY